MDSGQEWKSPIKEVAGCGLWLGLFVLKITLTGKLFTISRKWLTLRGAVFSISKVPDQSKVKISEYRNRRYG